MRCTALRGGALLAAAALLVSANDVEAQFPLTLVAGPNFATISTDDFDTGNRTGFFVGVGTAVPLSESVMFQPFVAYTQRGAEFEGTSSGTDTYTYFDVIGFLSTGFPVGETVDFVVSAGPRISFNLSCTEEEGGTELDCKDFGDYTGDTDFGILASLGLQFTNFGIGAGYDFGLSDVFEDIDGGYKNRGFYIYGAYTLMLGGS